MKIKHSKFKNTGILFELLVRQIASDTISGADSAAIGLVKKYFSKSELNKEHKEKDIDIKKVLDDFELPEIDTIDYTRYDDDADFDYVRYKVLSKKLEKRTQRADGLVFYKLPYIFNEIKSREEKERLLNFYIDEFYKTIKLNSNNVNNYLFRGLIFQNQQKWVKIKLLQKSL